MTNPQPQLDQLQALVAAIIEGLAETKARADANLQAIQALAEETKARTDANAQAIQALAEESKARADANLQAIQALVQSWAESKQRTDSNAKSIQALSDAIASDREKWQQERKDWAQDRRRVFEWMARLAAAQADFYEVQANHLTHIEEIDRRLTAILECLTPKDKQ